MVMCPTEPQFTSMAAIVLRTDPLISEDAVLSSSASNVSGESISAAAGTLAAGKELKRKLFAGLKKSVGFESKENLSRANGYSEGSKIPSEELKDGTGMPPASLSEANDELSSEERSLQEMWALKERRSQSLPSKNAKRKLKFRRSQAISFFKSRRDFGTSFSVPQNAREDEFKLVTDQELNSVIIKQGLSSCLSALALVLAVAFCLMVVTVHFSDLRWAQASDLQVSNLSTPANEPFSCWMYSWANQLLGFLAACLCLVVCSLLGERSPFKWPGSCQCCEDMVERSLSRAEEAEQKAQKAHRAKQQFMAYVFHNIRVPFNAIVLGLGHLRSTADKEVSNGEVRENTNLVQMMLDCAETMTSVLDDVTDMGQWEEGVMELNLEEFDLLAVVKFLSWGLKDLLYQKQICFSMNVDPVARTVLSSNHVIGDKHRVLQTLGNFLSNAVKFTPAGGRLDLSIKCEEVFRSNGGQLSKSGDFHKMESLQTQDCSLCPCLRVEGLSKPSKSHSNAPRCRPCCGEESFAKVLITVKDTGIGISAEDQAKLFEPYSFVTSGWVQKAGVSGLGLSMAKRFAEQSGGYIGVQSREGEGSLFYFSLPYPLVPVKHCVEYKLPSKEEILDTCMEDTQEDFRTLDGHTVSVNGDSKILQEKKFIVPSSLLSQKNANRRKVLLVEDTEINRIILRKVLQNLNLHCEEAENGQVAVDLLKQGKTYDLILMDKEMPVMDGHEATRQLRMMGVKTPIVALTGNALQSDRELFFEAGVDDFQTKPLSRDKLIQLLARFGVESSCADRRG